MYRKMFITSDGFHDLCEGITRVSPSGGVQYIGKDTMSTSGDIMIHVGELIDKSLCFTLKTPNIPRCSHDIRCIRCTEHTLYTLYRIVICKFKFLQV